MAKKSTVVYTLDLLVHVELTEGISFKRMQELSHVIKERINTISSVAYVSDVTITKTIIQKKVTY